MKHRTLLKSLRSLCLVALTTLSGLSLAQTGPGHQVINPPLMTDSPGKIEVLEFFSYTCIHCANINPAAKAWAKKLPADVVFKKVPVVYDPRQEPTAKLFYSLEVTGDLDRLDEAVFAAVHVQKVHLMTDSAVRDWVADKGVDMQKFDAAYRSFGVQSKVKRGVILAQTYKANSTPLFFVNGRYRMETAAPAEFDKMFRRIDELIGQSRNAKPRGIRG